MNGVELYENMRHNKAVLIEKDGERGIAFLLGVNLSTTWQSGDALVMWEDSEQTALPDGFMVINKNVFRP